VLCSIVPCGGCGLDVVLDAENDGKLRTCVSPRPGHKGSCLAQNLQCTV